MKNRTFIVYCDGSATAGGCIEKFNGGYGIVILDRKPDKKGTVPCYHYKSGLVRDTTNNRMELTAFIKSIEIIEDIINSDNTPPSEVEILINSDSSYLVRGNNEWLANWKKNGWKTASRKPVENSDLWKIIIEINKKFEIVYRWVRAHQKLDTVVTEQQLQIDAPPTKDFDIYFNDIADRLASSREVLNEEEKLTRTDLNCS
ncbi:MAG: ribonuclease H [Candidatus Dojkabacteria bacterium]